MNIVKFVVIFSFPVFTGCAKVSLETAEPIKVDVTMRVDIYQHVMEEVESIEERIHGEDKERLLNFLSAVPEVYAQEYSQEVMDAIERRRDRVLVIEDYFGREYVGETKDAYLENFPSNIPEEYKRAVEIIVEEENSDRETVYSAIAAKNKVDIKEIRKVFFKDHYDRAPGGYWFQIYSEGKGEFIWKRK